MSTDRESTHGGWSPTARALRQVRDILDTIAVDAAALRFLLEDLTTRLTALDERVALAVINPPQKGADWSAIHAGVHQQIVPELQHAYGRLVRIGLQLRLARPHLRAARPGEHDPGQPTAAGAQWQHLAGLVDQVSRHALNAAEAIQDAQAQLGMFQAGPAGPPSRVFLTQHAAVQATDRQVTTATQATLSTHILATAAAATARPAGPPLPPGTAPRPGRHPNSQAPANPGPSP